MAQPMYPDYEYEGDPEYAEYDDDYEYDNLVDDENSSRGEWFDERDSQNGGLTDMTYEEVYTYCAVPTLTSTAQHISILLALILAFTLIVKLVKLPVGIQHLLSCCSGGGVLWLVFGSKSVYLLGQILTGCISLGLAAAVCKTRLLQRPCGHQTAWTVTLVCLVYLLICEFWLVEATVWHSVRGAQMIILMKIISYAHDILPEQSPRPIEEQVETKESGKKCKNESDSYVESLHEEGQEVDGKDSKETNITNQLSGETKSNADEDLKTNTLRHRKSDQSDSSINKSPARDTVKDLEGTKDTTNEKKDGVAVGSEHCCSTKVAEWGCLGKGLELCGYLLHPGTVVFGPWCSLTKYREISEPMQWTILWPVNIVLTLSMSAVCLLGSTCFVPWLIKDDSNSWALAFRDALSFRMSHYFVSDLSEATANLGGIDMDMVSRLPAIEMPRSLLGVVINWNIPMHQFLKKYVFLRVRSTVGVWCAVLCTYSASAVIHGLNGQLCAVLLSLAVYTHAEHCLRVKLAVAFNACVMAKPCQQPCVKHTHKGKSITAMVINTVLGIVCMVHLAYLGVMFDSAPNSDSGYSIWHTLSKWRALNFASHWAVAFTYVVMLLI